MSRDAFGSCLRKADRLRRSQVLQDSDARHQTGHRA
jgi:hypothetical protein